MKKAYEASEKLGIPLTVGPVLSTDTFYGDDPDFWKICPPTAFSPRKWKPRPLHDRGKVRSGRPRPPHRERQHRDGELTTSEERKRPSST
jgi:hypothetical protein